jgi:hypothetical protein
MWGVRPWRAAGGACVVLAIAAVVLTAPAASRSTRACRAGDLTATFTAVPFSVGLGHISYVLTVTNRSASPCSLSGPVAVRLLDRRRHALPTHARTFPGGAYHVVLAPAQWAQADGRFSPDVAGPGESGPQCEPAAHFLRMTVASRSVTARMDPTPVCEHGQIAFARLAAVAPSPPCAAGSLTASFKRDSAPFGGQVSYSLIVRNLHSRCHTSSVLTLHLLSASGSLVPAHVDAGIRSPFVIPPGVKELEAATLRTTAGAAEPHHGACEPLASRLRVAPRPGSGALTVPIQPPLHACHGGLIEISSLGETG